MTKVSEYYDEYTKHQSNIGVNKRHRTIMEWLNKFGIQSNMKVLEIGCGIGTLTSLLAPALSSGELMANDISPKSVEIAKKNLSAYSNIEFVTGDMVTLAVNKQFDLIVMPDVLEHIPMDSHAVLFAKLAKLLKPEGFIFIHIPNPNYQVWANQHTPELQQIIDQAVDTEHLTRCIYPHGLYLHFLSTYSIWLENGDYQAIVIKKVTEKNYPEIIPPVPPLAKRLLNRLKRIVS